MSFGELKKLWSDFEDVPIDKDECIDENFHIWCKGTSLKRYGDKEAASHFYKLIIGEEAWTEEDEIWWDT